MNEAKTTLIAGGTLVLEDGILSDGALILEGTSIRFVGSRADAHRVLSGRQPDETYDAAGGWIFPGFIDVHVHGGGGGDTMDGTSDSLQKVARVHGSHGTTALLATTVTAELDGILAAARGVRSAMNDSALPDWGGARVLGMHLEGPYLNPARAGAQDPSKMRPASPDEIDAIVRAMAGGLRLVTLAPEQPCGMEALAQFAAAGVVVSLGHTDATYDEARAAFRAGARHVTHMFNGMRGLHHRDPGIGGAALVTDGVLCEVIADLIHVHPAMIELLYRQKGPDGVCLITDAIVAAGLGDGAYQLGGLDVIVKDGACRLAQGDSLAGSILTMDRAVGNVIRRAGVPPHHAARMASLNPARQLRIADRKGSLRVGKDADVCVVNDDFSATAVWVEGRRIR